MKSIRARSLLSHDLMILAALGFCAVGRTLAAGPCPYGVNAHLTRNEFENHERALEMMALAGIRHVRVPITYSYVCTNGVCDFTTCDAVFASCRKRGVEPMPVVDCAANAPADANRMADDPTDFSRYMRELLTHYRGQFKTLEFWNEPNIDPFWKAPNAANYVKLLKIVRELQREIDPNLRIAIAGMSKIPLAYLRQCYEAGAKDAFDVMNVHPYSHPCGPEGWTDVTDLQALMAEYGDGAKPIWFTEIGWPTAIPVIANGDLLQAGLALMRPEKKPIRAVYCDYFAEGVVPADQTIGRLIRDRLPRGSRCDCCSPRETIRRMDAGSVDVVVYPFGLGFPAETLDAAVRFVERGGVVVHFSILPFWRAGTETGPVKGMQNGEAMGRFKLFGFRNRFSRNGNFPSSVRARPTSAAVAAGAADREYVCSKYLVPGEGAEMIPVVSGRDEGGRELVSAAAFRNARGGGVLLNTVPADTMRRAPAGTTTEAEQAAKIARALAIAFAQGVEAVFTYEFRSWDNVDPWESETHYGLLHANYCPKPSYSAYMNFTAQRPAGSVNLPEDWRSADGRTYFPQWTRPDGKVAGMIWTLDAPHGVELQFDGPVEFYNLYGERFLPKNPAKGRYCVELSGNPIYFVNGKLKRPR